MYTRITAHSGCEGTDRDCLESIDRALDAGADAIEIDVRLSPSGELRVSHNELTEEEYKEKPLVKDAFARIQNTALMVNCDLKEQKALYPLLALAKEYGLNKDRLILTGCASPETLIRDPKLVEQAQVFLNFEEVVKYYYIARLGTEAISQMEKFLDHSWDVIRAHQELLDADCIAYLLGICKRLGAAGVNTNLQTVNPAFAAACQQADVPLSVWTVKIPEEQAKPMFDLNVWNITTIWPVAVKAIRGC